MTTHCRVLWPTSRSCWIDGKATLTIGDVEHHHELGGTRQREDDGLVGEGASVITSSPSGVGGWQIDERARNKHAGSALTEARPPLRRER